MLGSKNRSKSDCGLRSAAWWAKASRPCETSRSMPMKLLDLVSCLISRGPKLVADGFRSGFPSFGGGTGGGLAW